eukprot:m.192323 g.192323  ORF g.192323 m.192323 type:complete len:533 (-) comp14852_c0_seq8:466-2064(-)
MLDNIVNSSTPTVLDSPSVARWFFDSYATMLQRQMIRCAWNTARSHCALSLNGGFGLRTLTTATQPSETHKPRVAVVGAGPSGLYVSHFLLKEMDVAIDVFDRFPVPYGLVRYGVAPDHPEVKNCIATFETVFDAPDSRFFGHVSVGDNGDISVAELQKHYDAVVLSYGASQYRHLPQLQDGLANVAHARDFVGWYNGHPHHRTCPIDLENTRSCIIIGQGNVSLDCTRMMVADRERLQNTDIIETAEKMLTSSPLETVHVVGRRGALEAAWTIKELRELTRLPGVSTCLAQPYSLTQDETAFLKDNRPLRRKTEVLLKQPICTENQPSASIDSGSRANRTVQFHFQLSPKQLIESTQNPGHVAGVEFDVMELQGELGKRRAVPTGRTEKILCDAVLLSVGYKGEAISSNVPFNNGQGTIQHDGTGRVEDNLYCSGWIKTGPTGVIVSTMNDAHGVAKAIVADWKQRGPRTSKETTTQLEQILAELQKKTRIVTFSDFKKIEAMERELGKKHGKAAVKFVDVASMLETCAQD